MWLRRVEITRAKIAAPKRQDVFLNRHYGFFAIPCSETESTGPRTQTDNFCAFGSAGGGTFCSVRAQAAPIDSLAKQTLATAATVGIDPVAVADRIKALAKQKE